MLTAIVIFNTGDSSGIWRKRLGKRNNRAKRLVGMAQGLGAVCLLTLTAGESEPAGSPLSLPLVM